MCIRSAGKVSCSTSFLGVDCARPVFDSGAHALGISLFQDKQLRLYVLHLLDLGLHFGQTPLDKHFGVSAGTPAPIPHVKQLLDVAKMQAHSLEALYEPQPLGGGIVIEPVTRIAALGRLQEADSLVIAQGVSPKSHAPRQFGDGDGRHAMSR